MKKGVSKYDKHTEEWIGLYNQEQSYSDIAKKYCVSIAVVWRQIHPCVEKRELLFHSKKCQRYAIDNAFFEQIDTPNKAYILGFLLADGSQPSQIKQIRLKLQERDKHILEEINRELNYDKPLLFSASKNPKHQNQWELIICNQKITEDLEKHGIVKRKTFDIQYPEHIKDELFIHLFRGFWDGDGWFNLDKSSNGPCMGLVGEENFLRRLNDKLLELYGIEGTFRRDKRCDARIIQWRLRKRKDVLRLFELLYEFGGLHLRRKKESLRQYKEFYDKSKHR